MSTIPGVGMLHEHWVDETGVQLTTSMCPPPINIGTITTSFGVAPGSVGSAVYSGTSTTLVATGGSMVVQTQCDADGEFCHPAELSSMRVTFSDVVVEGTPVTNLDGNLAAPAPVAAITSSGVPTIAAADFQFEVVGTVMGGTSRMRFTPTQDITLAVGGQTATLNGQFDVLVDAPDKIIVPVTTSVTVNASTSNPGAACAGFTILESLLGFEDLDLWSSTQATLSLSPALHTQGCYGINVAGSGYMVLNSAPFATPLPGLTSTAALDVFVPPGQPNPFWLGAVQMYASCPSAGMNNAYLGQAELTGKPTGAFSTVRYALPSNVTTTLSRPHADCFFSIAVNVNATPSPVVLDNLRFVH